MKAIKTNTSKRKLRRTSAMAAASFMIISLVLSGCNTSAAVQSSVETVSRTEETATNAGQNTEGGTSDTTGSTDAAETVSASAFTDASVSAERSVFPLSSAAAFLSSAAEFPSGTGFSSTAFTRAPPSAASCAVSGIWFSVLFSSFLSSIFIPSSFLMHFFWRCHSHSASAPSSCHAAPNA